MLPVKDNMPQGRVPAATLALIALGVAAFFVVDDGGLVWLALDAYFLWLFGPSVEDSLGPLRYVVFCAVGGLAAAGAQLAIDADGVAAAAVAGPVAGVLGGYVLLYPRARLLTVSVVPFLFGVIEVPAVIVLPIWPVLEIVFGVGVPVLAGFAAGVVLVRLFVDPARDKRGLPPRVPAF